VEFFLHIFTYSATYWKNVFAMSFYMLYENFVSSLTIKTTKTHTIMPHFCVLSVKHYKSSYFIVKSGEFMQFTQHIVIY
jgi:hypothetical protein